MLSALGFRAWWLRVATLRPQMPLLVASMTFKILVFALVRRMIGESTSKTALCRSRWLHFFVISGVMSARRVRAIA